MKINFKISFIVLLLLLLLSEALLHAGRGRYWSDLRHVDTPGEALFNDRLGILTRLKGPKLLLAGDSLFYGSAMRERGARAWKETRMSSLFRSDPAWSGWQVIDLSADGLYLPDIEAALRAALEAKPDRVVLELNTRMFSLEAGEGPKVMARPWLRSRLDPARRAEVEAGLEKESFEQRLSLRLKDFLCRFWLLFRYSELVRDSIWGGSADKAVGRWMGRFFPAPAGDAETASMLLMMKVRPYYGSPEMGRGHQGRLALERICGLLEASGAKAFVFYTPQNLEALGEYMDRPAFEANRKIARSVCSGRKNITYRDWAREQPPTAFLDHCHLDPGGMAWLQKKISSEGFR